MSLNSYNKSLTNGKQVYSFHQSFNNSLHSEHLYVWDFDVIYSKNSKAFLGQFQQIPLFYGKNKAFFLMIWEFISEKKMHFQVLNKGKGEYNNEQLEQNRKMKTSNTA